MSGYRALAAVYDLFNRDVDYAAVADFVAGKLLRDEGQLLLDLGCGTGSLSVEMAARGFDVVAVDESADMLSVASCKAALWEREILFVNQPLQKLDLYGSFDCCIATFDTFNHLRDARELSLVLTRLRPFLNEGAALLFDVNSRYKHRHLLGNNTFCYTQEEVTLIWQCLLREDDSVDFEFTIFTPAANGLFRRSEDGFRECFLGEGEIREALTETGFALVQGPLDGFSDSPACESSDRLLFIAKKR